MKKETQTGNKDVYVYQVGKVASTSIANSITACGLNGKQTHFLGEKALSNILKQVVKPQTNEFFYFNKKGQLDENIEYTREINLKNHNNEKIFMISLARNPSTWYWSIVSQQFKGIKHQYENYCKATKQKASSIKEAMDIFYTDFLTFIQENDLPKLGNKNSFITLQDLKKRSSNAQKLFINELQLINRPMGWFDRNMKVFTGIDIYEKRPFDKYQTYENGNFHLLLIRYEDLGSSVTGIQNFLSLDKFELLKDNVSSKKEHDVLVKEMKAKYGKDIEEMLNLHETKYCKYFNY